jgi:hypothetical protein
LSRCLLGGAFEEAEEAAGEVAFEAAAYLGGTAQGLVDI